MFHALPDCIDSRQIGFHEVIHDNPAVYFQTDFARQFGSWSDTDRHDDKIGIDRGAVLEAQASDALVT